MTFEDWYKDNYEQYDYSDFWYKDNYEQYDYSDFWRDSSKDVWNAAVKATENRMNKQFLKELKIVWAAPKNLTEALFQLLQKYENTNPEDLFFKWRKKEYPHKADIKYDSYAMEAFEAGWRSLWDNDHD